MSHYCSGFRLWLWPLWLSLGPSLGNLPSEISTEALARDRMWCRCLWRCCLPLAVLLPLRRACRSPSDAAVFQTSTAASLPSPFAAELVGLGRALAFARAWCFDIAERQCFASRPCIRFASALHPLCIRRGARATGLVFTSLGTSHVALHCLRLALVRVRSACFICSFVLVVELDLAVLFILDISPASLVGLLVRAPRGSRILYPSPGAFDFTRRTLSPLAFP